MTQNHEMTSQNLARVASVVAHLDDPHTILLVLEAMLPTAVSEARQNLARAPRKTVKRANSYQRWNAEQIAALHEYRAAGLTSAQIARKMGRSTTAISHAISRFSPENV